MPPIRPPKPEPTPEPIGPLLFSVTLPTADSGQYGAVFLRNGQLFASAGSASGAIGPLLLAATLPTSDPGQYGAVFLQGSQQFASAGAAAEKPPEPEQPPEQPEQPLPPEGPTRPPERPEQPPEPEVPPDKPPASGETLATLQVSNPTSEDIEERLITFAMPFAPGRVGGSLSGIAGGQLSALRHHEDGSVRHAAVTLTAPALGPGEKRDLDVSLASPSGGVLALEPLLKSVVLTLSGDLNDEIPINTLIDEVEPDLWCEGPLMTEARYELPLRNAFRLVVDLRYYRDDTARIVFGFRNDGAMGETGGALVYTASIAEDGRTVYGSGRLTHHQYQLWHYTHWVGGEPGHHLVHDVAALDASGAVHAYDLALHVSESVLSKPCDGPQFAPLGPGDIQTQMGTGGGRPDIGPDPLWNAAWHISQDPRAYRYALAQSDAMGSCPWHLWDLEFDRWVNPVDRPNLWADGRQPPSDGGLTQPQDTTACGWMPEAGHQPDPHYLPYLLTGDRHRGDMLDAQAAWSIMWVPPASRQFEKGVFGSDLQVRSQAWSLRQLVDSAYLSPSMGELFSELVQNNFTSLLGLQKTKDEPQFTIPGIYGYDTPPGMAPWQQDYYATSLIRAVRMGLPNARECFDKLKPYLTERFTKHGGYNPANSLCYNWFMQGGTWESCQQVSTEHQQTAEYAPNAYGWCLADGSPWCPGDINQYGELALSLLHEAARIDPAFAPARDWLAANSECFDLEAAYQQRPQHAWRA